MAAPTADDLPLRLRTPTSWARAALAAPVALLDDHAHLEKKAAANALGLLLRGPTGTGLEEAATWARTLAAVARDEVEHLGLVLRLLERRGGRLSAAVHRNPYAAALRRLVRSGSGAGEVLDRLLVSAAIEARSCERFEILAEAAEDDDLRGLYRGLRASERGHYRTFLGLAATVATESEAASRWDEVLEAEARILSAQAAGPRMHAGWSATV